MEQVEQVVEQEVVEQQVEEQVEVASVEQPLEQQEEVKEPTNQEMNFKLLREKNERIERERNALAEKLKSYEQAAPVKPVEEESFGFAEDDLIEGRHLKKVTRELRTMQKKLKAQETANNQMAIENRLKSQYPDFDSIVSKDNVEILKLAHPEIAATLSASSDLYSSAVSAYTFIKKMGIGNDAEFKKDKEVAHRNATKPRPSASVSPQQGDSPLSHANAFANGLTDELKAALLREMNEARKAL